MKRLLFILLLVSLIPGKLFSQEKEDSKITVIVQDTVGIYNKVKIALVRENFIVKDLNIKDTLSTYPAEFNGIYIVVFAVVNANTVTLSGVYNLKKIDYFGYNSPSKNYKRIIYYKGSKTWSLLMSIARNIGADIAYKK